MEEIKKEISSYWTGRSEDFARLREEELNSEMAELWLRELKKGLPEGEGFTDSGCGNRLWLFLRAAGKAGPSGDRY